MRFRIAINRMALDNKLAEGDPRWKQFTGGFVNQELETIEIANAIYTGHAYCPWQLSQWRASDNFDCAQHIAVDLDTGDARSSFNHLLTLDLVQMYAGLMHTTPSHTQDHPRARVLFFLDQPIPDPEGYRQAVVFWLSLFDGADPVCKDPSRFFYGAKSCEIWFSDNVLPIAHLRHYYREWKQHQPQDHTKIIRLDEYRKPPADVDAARALDLLAERVRGAREGSRNNTLNAQAFLAGKDVRRALYSRQEAEAALLAAARAIGLDDDEAIRTIRNGLRGGERAATA